MKNSPLKILYLIAHCGQGGDWSVVKTLAAQMPGDQTQIWLNGTHWQEGAPPPDGPIRINQGWRAWVASRKMGKSLPRDLDVIHAHSPVAILMALLLRFWHAPTAQIVFTFHWPTKDSPLRKQVKRWLFSKCDTIHCVSIAIAENLKTNYGVPQTQIKFNYLGVDARRFRPIQPEVKNALRTNFGWGPENFVLGYLGRFDREKNVDWLIRFMAEKSNAYPDVRLLLYGGGALQDVLKNQAAEWVEEGKIQFGGYTREPEKAYGLMDLHLLPSSFEAFALTVVEAALCGIPSLRTNVEGAVDQIEDGVDGFLCDISGGYEAFSNRLEDVLTSCRESLPEVGKRSSRKLTALCDLERFGQEMMRIYRGT